MAPHDAPAAEKDTSPSQKPSQRMSSALDANGMVSNASLTVRGRGVAFPSDRRRMRRLSSSSIFMSCLCLSHHFLPCSTFQNQQQEEEIERVVAPESAVKEEERLRAEREAVRYIFFAFVADFLFFDNLVVRRCRRRRSSSSSSSSWSSVSRVSRHLDFDLSSSYARQHNHPSKTKNTRKKNKNRPPRRRPPSLTRPPKPR